jgi:hypothetical protein
MPRVAAEGDDGLQVHYLTVRVERFAIRIYNHARHVLLKKLIETLRAVTGLSGLKLNVPGVSALRTLGCCGDNESHADASPAVHRQAVGGLGLGGFAFWRGGREAEVMPAFAGIATFAASRGWATAATAFAPATTPGAVQGAPAFLLNFTFLGDQVVDAAVQAKADDLLSVLIGRRHRAETELCFGVIYEPTYLPHGLGPLYIRLAM